MIAAPGNYLRSEYFPSEDSFFLKIGKRFLEINTDIMPMIGSLLILLVISVVLYLILKDRKIKNHVYFIYLLGTLAAIYSMVASPYFPERAWFGITVFLMIAIGIFLEHTNCLKNVFRYILYGILLFFIAWFFHRYIRVLSDNIRLVQELNTRQSYIQMQKQEGNLNIVINTGRIVPKYPVYNSFLDGFGDPNNGINKMMAKYYGIESITIYKEETAN